MEAQPQQDRVPAARQSGDLERFQSAHGVARLMTAVLEDALECCRLYVGASNGRQRRLFREAFRWFESADRSHVFAFETICDVLELDARRLRRYVRSIRRRAVTVPGWQRPSRTEWPIEVQPACAPGGSPQKGRAEMNRPRKEHYRSQEPAITPPMPEIVVELPDAAYELLGYVRAFPEGVHGYELGQALARSRGSAVMGRLGTIYRRLRQLEQAGLLRSHLDTAAARLRHRFTITPLGECHFGEWLLQGPAGQAVTADALLQRLRFADSRSAAPLRRMVDQAADERRRELEDIRQTAFDHRSPAPASPVYTKALEARAILELDWLHAVRRLLIALDRTDVEMLRNDRPLAEGERASCG
jgi:DNA-binding PadR family transcriptional regulator